jgi:hypothetical protein
MTPEKVENKRGNVKPYAVSTGLPVNAADSRRLTLNGQMASPAVPGTILDESEFEIDP